MSVEQDDEERAAVSGVEAKVCQRWSRFDQARREEFLDAIRRGVRSRTAACDIIGLNRSTQSKWVARGKLLDLTDEEGEVYRTFYLDLKRAEAVRDSMPDVCIFEAAPKDWRAAAALAKMQERRQRRRDGLALAKANVERIEAETRIARLKAELMERELAMPAAAPSPSARGRKAKAEAPLPIYYPGHAWPLMTPEEQIVLRPMFERNGYIPSSKEAEAEN